MCVSFAHGCTYRGKKYKLSYGRPIAYFPNIFNTYLDALLDFILKLDIKLFVKGIGEKRIVAKTSASLFFHFDMRR